MNKITTIYCVLCVAVLIAGCAFLPQRITTAPDGTVTQQVDMEATVAIAQLSAQLSSQAVDLFIVLNDELKIVDPERYDKELQGRKERAERDRALLDAAIQKFMGVYGIMPAQPDNTPLQ